jgi:hypothetical protein
MKARYAFRSTHIRPGFLLCAIQFAAKLLLQGAKSAPSLVLLQHFARDSRQLTWWSLVIRLAEDQDKKQAGGPADKLAEDGAQWTS